MECVNRWAPQRPLEPSSWFSISVAAVIFFYFVNNVLSTGCTVCQQLRKYGNTFITYLICHKMPGSLCPLCWVVRLIFFPNLSFSLAYNSAIEYFCIFCQSLTGGYDVVSAHQASIYPKVPMIYDVICLPVFHCWPFGVVIRCSCIQIDGLVVWLVDVGLFALTGLYCWYCKNIIPFGLC